MKTMILLVLAVLLFPLVVWAQQAQATLVPFTQSKRVSVSLYDDMVHWRKFGQSFRNPLLKRSAIVVSNQTDQLVVASGVIWKWTDATGKPGLLYLQQDSFRSGVFLAAAHSERLIVPSGVPQTASQVSVELDVMILADGEVMGPDQYKLVEDLKARDQASKIIAKILIDAKGSDPKPEIEKAIANAPDRSALRRHLAELSITPGGGRIRMPQQLKQLPNFYRRQR